MLKKISFCLGCLGLTFLQAADSTVMKPQSTESFSEQEVKDLKEWIKKRNQVVAIKSFGGELTLSGELHSSMNQTNEVVDGIKQRGAFGAYPSEPTHVYSVEVDLLLNYRADFTWATAKLKFKNKAGTTDGSGSVDKVSLDRAFYGVRCVEGDTYTIDFEVGRRKLNYTFDSLIQFGAFMDGMLLKYDQSFDTVGDFYIHAGPFVVNFKNDQYAYIAEVGLLNIANTGIYTKYSFIDWDTKHFSNPLKQDEYRFMNSQVILGYKVVPKWIGKVLTVYTAGLINSAAKELAVTNNKKANIAWYAGFSVGEAKKKGDWSLNADYQYVMPQAIPAFDNAGIGRGNIAGTGFYCANSTCTVANTKETAVGNNNYKGFEVTLLYLFSDNLTLRQNYQMSIRQDKAVGPIFRYKQYGLELIYLF